MITPDIAFQACRFLHDASLMLLWGGSAFLLFLAPRTLSARVWQRLGPLTSAAILLAIAMTALSLPLESGIIGNGWGDVFDLETIHDVLFDTTVGMAWQAQAVASILLLVTLFAPHGMQRPAVALSSALGLAGLTLTGHAAMHQGLLAVAHRTNDVIHVLAGGGWFGGLVPLIPILRLLGREDCRREARLALTRFSNIGHAAVALVIVSGIVNTMLVLGHLPTDWSSPYQALLALKIALVAGMTMLAVVNRYVFVPWMQRKPANALNAIRLGTMAEILLGTAAIAAVGIFGMLEPV